MIILEDLTPIFSEVFDEDSLEVTREMTADDVDSWDSLSHMNLVLAIEIRFKVKFALGELQGLKCVGEMLDLINRKLA